jgi:predicted NUDIX family NTP pyrophosphohydrolase
MAKHSAGILMYRLKNDRLEVFLVHPGGPFWAGKDEHAWSIPKGELLTGESSLEAAKREFEEETSMAVNGDFFDLGTLKQSSGKQIRAWAVEGDCNPADVKSNPFSMEWPPHSGKTQSFPEIDKGAWFGCKAAREKLHKGQVEFLDRLLKRIGYDEEGKNR